MFGKHPSLSSSKNLKDFMFNPFLANIPVSYPSKHQKRSSGVFKGQKIGALARNELRDRAMTIFLKGHAGSNEF